MEGDSQHFLVSAAARTLDLKRVARMSDEDAYRAFILIRYSETDGKPFCPRCGCFEHYELKKRRKFKCRACSHQYSVTSGTIFASRKLEFRDILLAIALFTNGAKGMSALQLGRDLNVQIKTAFVLLHKLREAMGAHHKAKEQLAGHVEMDGAYFGGYVKPRTAKADRIDRRIKQNRSGKRQCVVVYRERKGRSLAFVGSEKDGAEAAPRMIAPGSIIYADEAVEYNPLHAFFTVKRINHQKEYAKPDGTSTNQAESFFSRLRRYEVGTHHHIAGPYLGAYASEASWREDHRRMPNGDQFLTIVSAGLHHPVSRMWKGYWQRRKEAA